MTGAGLDLLFRSYAEGDARALGRVFHRAVHEGARAH